VGKFYIEDAALKREGRRYTGWVYCHWEMEARRSQKKDGEINSPLQMQRQRQKLLLGD